MWCSLAASDVYKRQAYIPTKVTYSMVSQQARHVICFGANNQNGTGAFDPLLVRWSSSEDYQDWRPLSTNSAGDFRLEQGSQIVSAVKTRQEILIFTDTAVYTTSAQKVENMFLRAEGGVIKRAGLEYIYRNDDITYSSAYRQVCRLIPFIFSDDEQYIISIQHQKVRAFYIDPTTGDLEILKTIF